MSKDEGTIERIRGKEELSLFNLNLRDNGNSSSLISSRRRSLFFFRTLNPRILWIASAIFDDHLGWSENRSPPGKIIRKIFPDIRLYTFRPSRIETEGLNLCLESSRSLISTPAKKETRISVVIDVVGEIKSHGDETWSHLSCGSIFADHFVIGDNDYFLFYFPPRSYFQLEWELTFNPRKTIRARKTSLLDGVLLITSRYQTKIIFPLIWNYQLHKMVKEVLPGVDCKFSMMPIKKKFVDEL